MQTIAGLTILVHNRLEAQSKMNDILSLYGNIIRGRMGLPHLHNDSCVISLVLQGTEEEIDNLHKELKGISSIEQCEIIIAKF